MSPHPYTVTHYSIYIKENGIAIFDSRIEQHKPIFLKGTRAYQFKDLLETLMLQGFDEAEYAKRVETLCEKFRYEKL